MCTLCVEVQKHNMTAREVASAFREFDVPDNHLAILMAEIEKFYGLEEVAGELEQIEVTEHYQRARGNK